MITRACWRIVILCRHSIQLLQDFEGQIYHRTTFCSWTTPTEHELSTKDKLGPALTNQRSEIPAMTHRPDDSWSQVIP